MRIHCLQHVPFEGPAYLETVARYHGAEISATRLFDGEPLPRHGEYDILTIMGGPMGVHDDGTYPWMKHEKKFVGEAITGGKTIIGICLGAQLIADVMGAAVYKNRYREIGWFPVMRSGAAASSGIGAAFPEKFTAFHWHGDTFDIPAGAIRVAGSHACRNQGFVYDERVVALQFHLEATPESVRALLDNCPDDLDGTMFVQGEEDIDADMYYAECNQLFGRIFNTLVGLKR